MTLYIVTETEDGEEPSVFLADRKPKDYNRDGYSLTSKEASFDDVTTDMIVSAVNSEFENANYHDFVGLPDWLLSILWEHLPEEKVKDIFWALVLEQGLLWNDFEAHND